MKSEKVSRGKQKMSDDLLMELGFTPELIAEINKPLFTPEEAARMDAELEAALDKFETMEIKLAK